MYQKMACSDEDFKRNLIFATLYVICLKHMPGSNQSYLKAYYNIILKEAVSKVETASFLFGYLMEKVLV